MNNRQLFLKHLAQTSPNPIGLEMVKAQGIYLYDVDNKKYIDGISGFSVANIGHGNQQVIDAVTQQANSYMHLIVYGEFIQQPQVAYANLLAQHLPKNLDTIYFTNSGAEATEGALKLAKRITGRSKIIGCNNAYHGSTQGALSVMGSEYWRNAYRPLLPNVYHYNFNDDQLIDAIDANTACVILEPIQAEAGIIKANKVWLEKLRQQCNKYCVLLIFDEIQSGFGRSGKLWAFEHYTIEPDILLLGKALGGGMPLGAFISSNKLMSTLANNPVLGHISTFAGHPVSCAAGMAAFTFLLGNNIIENVIKKEQLLLQNIVAHSSIQYINSAGLWCAIGFLNFDAMHKVAQKCIANGLITDWFLFADNCIRIAPPLIATNEEILEIAQIINKSISEAF
jgi:acetylornithine/N-succinyldiaminopimelate aminotransferase